MIDPDALYLRSEAASLLRQPERTLSDWAYRGEGPSYHRCGKRAIYKGADLLAYLESRRIEGHR